ncbi:MAG: hypothetical protein RLY78_2727, partial [Pseudomonadota bacterium]
GMTHDTPASSTPPSPAGRAGGVTLPLRLKALAELATLLEKLEREPGSASADQYRHVVERTRAQLQTTERDEALERLLRVRPALAELYENLHYAQAGLCRAPLEPALHAELAASALLRRLRQRSGPPAQA